jgi:hypothetical protein
VSFEARGGGGGGGVLPKRAHARERERGKWLRAFFKGRAPRKGWGRCRRHAILVDTACFDFLSLRESVGGARAHPVRAG